MKECGSAKEWIEALRDENVSHETIEYGLVEVSPAVRVNAVVSAVVNKAMDEGIEESFRELFSDDTSFMVNFKVSDVAYAGYFLITGKKLASGPEIEDLLENRDEIFHF